MGEVGVTGCRLLDLNPIGNDQGWLVSLEAEKSVPFAIKRVYYIYGTVDDVRRGLHAHYNLEQLIVCVSGSCLFLVDDGNNKIELKLDNPRTGLHIKGVVWREMSNFSSDCVLMVLASELYDESDYIRCYEDFISVTSEGLS